MPDTLIPSQNLFDGETDDSAASIDSLMADAMNEDEGSDHVNQVRDRRSEQKNFDWFWACYLKCSFIRCVLFLRRI